MSSRDLIKCNPHLRPLLPSTQNTDPTERILLSWGSNLPHVLALIFGLKVCLSTFVFNGRKGGGAHTAPTTLGLYSELWSVNY